MVYKTDELHIYEKKVLKAFESLGFSLKPEKIAKKQKMNIKAVMSAAGSLESKNLVKIHRKTDYLIRLNDEGLKYAKEGLPERRLLNYLLEKKSIKMKDLFRESPFEKKDINIGIGWLKKKNCIKIKKGVLEVTKKCEKFIDKDFEDEKLLKELLKKEEIWYSSLTKDLKKGYELLKNRGLLDIKEKTTHVLEITEEGKKLLDEGLEIIEEATQVTHEDLKSGRWKRLKYRPYDIFVEYPKIYPGKTHPLRDIIEEIRKIFISMGFKESRGPIVESAFWNFDSLFQPQDHAAREMQDTFYLKNPKICDLPDEKLVKKVKDVHEHGGSTGSEGWGYKWDISIAKKPVLRTHTTCISARFLFENKPPVKMFSIGRVFRRETITYKHLPEFHQVEGIIASKDVTFRDLLGTLREFYKKLGFEVRFRPAYFPYTYLSTECEIYLPEKGSWIELGGAGMFRPEVLEPLGIKTPVAAFGLGIERLAMIKLGIDDIRMLYRSNIEWLRKNPLVKGIKLS